MTEEKQSDLLKASESYAPHHYPWAIEMAKVSEQMHWHVGEASLQEDVIDWRGNKLSPVEKEHVIGILRIFTQSDTSVATNYIELFLSKFKNNDIRHMLLSFANREGEHQRAYATLNETLGLPESSFSDFLKYKEMKDKIEFMLEADVSSHAGLALAIVKAVFNEGVSLFAAFAMLLNYQRFGKMKGMCEINSWSLRDETLHCEGMVKMFRAFCDEHPRIVTDDFKKEIYDIVRKVVSLEDHFLDLIYKVGEPEGLAKDDVKKYVRYIADRRLIQLGLKGNFRVKENPLPWMDWMISGDSFSNFFESKVVDYSKAGFSGDEWGYPVRIEDNKE